MDRREYEVRTNQPRVPGDRAAAIFRYCAWRSAATGGRAATFAIMLVAMPAASVATRPVAQIAHAESTTVDSSQRVTAIGEYPSLRGLITDLCWQAHVKLLAYDLPEDRSVRVHFENRPLHAVLQSLLRDESFVVGFDGAASDPPRVTWLRVLGDTEAARARGSTVDPRQSPRELWVPPDDIAQAFGATDEATRNQAIATISSRLLEDPEQRRAFLQTDPRAIANVLRRYPEAETTLRSAREKITEQAFVDQVDAILAALAARPADRPRFR